MSLKPIKYRHKQQWLKNHNKHLFKLKVRSRDIRRRKHKRFLGMNKEERKQLRIMDSYRDFVRIYAPTNFSLIENPLETLGFISKLENCFKNKSKVFVRLRNVEHIEDGALVVLLSSLIKFRSHNIDFNGDFPKSTKADKRLKESGFFNELFNMKRFEVKDSYDIARRSIFTHASKIVDTKLSANLIRQISKKIWGQERRCLGVQRAYIELMQNTNNHASLHKQGEHYWWTTVSYDCERKVACFSFIDYGIGIINSITTDNRSKLHKIFSQFRNKFNGKNDSELLELLLKGDIHSIGLAHSSTRKYFRGKGLPGIYNACKDNNLSNLVVISNKAMAEVSEDKYTLLDKNFSGTFVYWEVNTNNTNLPISCR
jgi:hypothetical protein